MWCVGVLVCWTSDEIQRSLRGTTSNCSACVSGPAAATNRASVLLIGMDFHYDLISS